MNTTKTYRLARTFCEDHWYRGCGDTDTIVSESNPFVVVEMDAAGYADMLSDADYYWTCRDQFDSDYRNLCASARRVRDALIKAGPPVEVTA